MAAVIDDVVVVSEDAVGEPVGPLRKPLASACWVASVNVVENVCGLEVATAQAVTSPH